MKDIETIEDIELLVNTFYSKVRKDDVIGFFFNDVAKTNWEEHLPKMYLFWRALLFMDIKFDGNPVGAHIPINLQVPMDFGKKPWMNFSREKQPKMPKTKGKTSQK